MKPTQQAARGGGYSPVVTSDDGSVLVELDADHPGFSDPEYRERRNAIARLSLDHHEGDPIPTVEYTDQEHEVWQIVSSEIAPRHERHACSSFLDSKASLGLPEDRIPQLTEVTDLLRPRTGFGYQPVAGLAPLREFYSSFARRTFYSTQYIRHPSVPKYTPEPDIVHEVIGHANQLADPNFAEICLEVGHRRRAHRVRRGTRLPLTGLLVHDGVRRRVGGRRAEGLRRGDPLVAR